MDERSSLLDNQQQQNPDLLSPNLRPRHPNLIPTPCGPIKSWSELSVLVRLYFCFTIASLLALLGVTSSSIYKQHMNTDVSDEDNFTVSLIQLIGILFCVYYISRGVLQENRQELVAFVLSVLGVMIRSVVNFSVVGSKGKQELLARFVCIMCLGVVHVFCTMLLIWRPNMMAFRVSGALESLQEQYFLLNLCFSMVTFDLQTQLCLCILFTTSDSFMLADKTVILAVGVAGVIWALLTAAVGAVAVRSAPPSSHCTTPICHHIKIWLIYVLHLSGVKGSHGSGLDLHGAEPSPSCLLCLSDVHGGGELVPEQNLHAGGSRRHRGFVFFGHQSGFIVGPRPTRTQLWTGPERENVCIQTLRAHHHGSFSSLFYASVLTLPTYSQLFVSADCFSFGFISLQITFCFF
uniref:DUF7789 domain-containing protein n=1 Tax=Nothobranchius pienaari TaxID=704102 RepID=A0A1A8NTW0_9TELE